MVSGRTYAKSISHILARRPRITAQYTHLPIVGYPHIKANDSGARRDRAVTDPENPENPTLEIRM